MSEHIETAAGAEAERRWPVVGEHGSTFTYPLDALRESRRAAFTLGAAWQAAQPRTVSAAWLMEAWWAASGEGWAVPQHVVVAFARQLGFTVAEAGEVR